MKILLGLLALVAPYGLNAANFDDVGNAGFGVKFGSLGYGVDLSMTLTKTVNARVSLTHYNFDPKTGKTTIGDSVNQANINYKADIVDYGSRGLLLDWYVFDGTFHLSTGLVKPDISLKIKGTLDKDFIINGNKVRVEDVRDGQITGEFIVSDSYRPYLGIGWGRKASYDPGLSVSLELGVIQIEPELHLSATVGNQTEITQADLDKYLKQAEDLADIEIAKVNLFPVVSIGINYAF